MTTEAIIRGMWQLPAIPGWLREFTCALLGVIVVALVTARMVLQRRRRHRPNDWRCRRCGYDLRGSPGGICPECGRKSATHNVDRIMGIAARVAWRSYSKQVFPIHVLYAFVTYLEGSHRNELERQGLAGSAVADALEKMLCHRPPGDGSCELSPHMYRVILEAVKRARNDDRPVTELDLLHSLLQWPDDEIRSFLEDLSQSTIVCPTEHLSDTCPSRDDPG